MKRYKYVGKERDEETGLYYYGARYYSAWLGRFVSVDPLQHKYPYYTPYQYAGNKPITYIDLDGLEPTESDIINVAAQRIINDNFDPKHNLWKNESEIDLQIKRSATSIDQDGKQVFNENFYNSLKERVGQLYNAYSTLDALQPETSYQLFTNLIGASKSFEELGMAQEAMIAYANDIQTRLDGISALMQVDGITSLINISAISWSISRLPKNKTFSLFPRRNAGESSTNRLPQDINVNPKPPKAKSTGNIGRTGSQNNFTKRYVELLKRSNASDIRINQHQVNASGERVGINRPDIQFTFNGKRFYVEIDRSTSSRGVMHKVRILSNDPKGNVRTRTMD